MGLWQRTLHPGMVLSSSAFFYSIPGGRARQKRPNLIGREMILEAQIC